MYARRPTYSQRVYPYTIHVAPLGVTWYWVVWVPYGPPMGGESNLWIRDPSDEMADVGYATWSITC